MAGCTECVLVILFIILRVNPCVFEDYCHISCTQYLLFKDLVSGAVVEPGFHEVLLLLLQLWHLTFAASGF